MDGIMNGMTDYILAHDETLLYMLYIYGMKQVIPYRERNH